jgi:hypothetical protein
MAWMVAGELGLEPRAFGFGDKSSTAAVTQEMSNKWLISAAYSAAATNTAEKQSSPV